MRVRLILGLFQMHLIWGNFFLASFFKPLEFDAFKNRPSSLVRAEIRNPNSEISLLKPETLKIASLVPRSQ
jgi:hypothetical protein